MIETARSLLVLFLVLLTVATQADAGEWYEGGTLHKETAKEWHSATYENRLATCSDFVTASAPKDTQDRLFSNNMTLLKVRSISLDICITKATDDPSLMFMKVNEIAAACIVLLNYNL